MLAFDIHCTLTPSQQTVEPSAKVEIVKTAETPKVQPAKPKHIEIVDVNASIVLGTKTLVYTSLEKR